MVKYSTLIKLRIQSNGSYMIFIFLFLWETITIKKIEKLYHRLNMLFMKFFQREKEQHRVKC